MMFNQEQMTDHVLEVLGARYQVGNKVVQGQALSFVRSHLYDKGWKGLGHLSNFEDVLGEIGFEVVDGRTERFARDGSTYFGGPCRVVTL